MFSCLKPEVPNVMQITETELWTRFSVEFRAQGWRIIREKSDHYFTEIWIRFLANLILRSRCDGLPELLLARFSCPAICFSGQKCEIDWKISSAEKNKVWQDRPPAGFCDQRSDKLEHGTIPKQWWAVRFPNQELGENNF